MACGWGEGWGGGEGEGRRREEERVWVTGWDGGGRGRGDCRLTSAFPPHERKAPRRLNRILPPHLHQTTCQSLSRSPPPPSLPASIHPASLLPSSQPLPPLSPSAAPLTELRRRPQLGTNCVFHSGAALWWLRLWEGLTAASRLYHGRVFEIQK